MMYATIQKWGNSNALRIPKPLLDALSLRENDRVELTQTRDAITIRKAAPAAHKTLEERLTAFYGKPVDEINRLPGQELDWGGPEGDEAW
jgi:antitoxin MazE